MSSGGSCGQVDEGIVVAGGGDDAGAVAGSARLRSLVGRRDESTCATRRRMVESGGAVGES